MSNDESMASISDDTMRPILSSTQTSIPVTPSSPIASDLLHNVEAASIALQPMAQQMNNEVIQINYFLGKLRDIRRSLSNRIKTESNEKKLAIEKFREQINVLRHNQSNISADFVTTQATLISDSLMAQRKSKILEERCANTTAFLENLLDTTVTTATRVRNHLNASKRDPLEEYLSLSSRSNDASSANVSNVSHQKENDETNKENIPPTNEAMAQTCDTINMESLDSNGGNVDKEAERESSSDTSTASETPLVKFQCKLCSKTFKSLAKWHRHDRIHKIRKAKKIAKTKGSAVTKPGDKKFVGTLGRKPGNWAQKRVHVELIQLLADSLPQLKRKLRK